MAETILKIEEIHEGDNRPHTKGYAGFIIYTDQQEIILGIENNQLCCEDYGYIASDDDLQYFIGTQIRGISLVDDALNSMVADAATPMGDTNNDDNDKVYDAVFINIETSVGILQLAVYNGHNGYYGHKVHLISQQIKYEAEI